MAFLVSDQIKHKKPGEKIASANDIDWEGFEIPTPDIDAYTKDETDQKIQEAIEGVTPEIPEDLEDRLGGIEEQLGGISDEISQKIAEVVSGAPEDFDTLKEIADWIQNDTTGAAGMANSIKDLDEDLDSLYETVGEKDVITSWKDSEGNEITPEEYEALPEDSKGSYEPVKTSTGLWKAISEASPKISTDTEDYLEVTEGVINFKKNDLATSDDLQTLKSSFDWEEL